MIALRRCPMLLGLLLLLASLGESRAGAPDVSVSVLGIDADGVSAAAAQALTDALRRRLSSAPGVRAVPGKDLVEMKLIFGCMDERPVCLSQAGRTLGAERLLYGSLRRPASGAGYTVTLKQLHVPTGRVEKFISDTVSARALSPDGAEIDSLVGRWLGVLIVGTLQGGLQIATDPPGAQVVLDGKPAGQTPLLLRDVPTGTHVAKIALSGYDQVVRTFTVQGGMVHDLSVVLHSRAQPALVAPPFVEKLPATALPPDRGRPFRIASYFLIGAAALLGGVSIYTWRTYSDEEGTAGAAAKDLRGALDLQSMQLPASPEVNAFFQSTERLSSCEPPAELTIRAMASPESRAVYQSYLDHCKRGRSYADATTGLVATMGSLALLGVTSYILGRALQTGRQRIGPDDAYKDKRAAWLYRPRLIDIAPTAGVRGGGLSLSFQF